MAYPVVVLPSERQFRVPHFNMDRTRTKQKAPFNIAASYFKQQSQTMSVSSYGGVYTDDNMTASTSDSTYGLGRNVSRRFESERIWANNSAYDRFVEAAQSSAMTYVNWRERHQAVDSVVRRSSQLMLFTRAIIRRSPRQAALALGVDPAKVPRGVYRRTKGVSKALGSTWLEWHFGWDPLIKDIQTSVKVLTSPPSSKRIKVTSKVISTQSQKSGGAPPPVWGSYIAELIRGKVTTRCQAEVAVTDPNLYMANQLGLTNPLAIAWEIMPYSFVIDWFANVGSYLNSYTDFMGLKVYNGTTTQVVRASCLFTQSIYYPSDSPDYRVVSGVTGTQVGFSMTRGLGVPSVRLGMRPPRPIGAVRGFTAIALLLNLMKKSP